MDPSRVNEMSNLPRGAYGLPMLRRTLCGLSVAPKKSRRMVTFALSLSHTDSLFQVRYQQLHGLDCSDSLYPKAHAVRKTFNQGDLTRLILGGGRCERRDRRHNRRARPKLLAEMGMQ
jgi:hypothetical protein